MRQIVNPIKAVATSSNVEDKGVFISIPMNGIIKRPTMF